MVWQPQDSNYICYITNTFVLLYRRGAEQDQTSVDDIKYDQISEFVKKCPYTQLLMMLSYLKTENCVELLFYSEGNVELGNIYYMIIQ